jgi:tetratricopeptide (TPR) repeat protein
MVDDVERLGGVEGEKRAAARAAARAEQGLGDWEEAGLWLERIRDAAGALTPAERRIARNILRRADADEGILASLRASLEAASGMHASLIALEGAEVAWRRGASPFEVFDWLEDVDWRGTSPSAWSLFRHAQVTTDARLERGDETGAREALVAGLDRLDEVTPEATALTERLAVWHHLRGCRREAFAALDELLERDHLGGDLGDFYRFLGYELDAHDLLRRALVEEGLADHRGERTLLPATFEIVRHRGDVDRALDWWTASSDLDASGPPGLRARSHLLEHAHVRSNRSDRREAFLEVLEHRLDLDLEPFERTRLLLRIGELYEARDDDDATAVPLYLEALEARPGWAPALRRLADVYARHDDWHGLADLHVYELDHLDDPTRRTRRHRALGHLYREALDQPREALEHYRKVLEFRGYDRDALEGAADILSALDCWAELVELCHTAASRAPDDRVRAEWWTRAADVAERHLGDLARAAEFRRDVLELEVGDVETWTSLRRLYRRSERWRDLLELFEDRLEVIETPEVVAETCLRAARLCEEHLEMPGRARHYYRRSLEAVPDHEPTFDGWRRHLRDRGDWGELAELLEREIEALDHGPRLERTHARLADVTGRHLEHRVDAAERWAQRLENDPPTSDDVPEAWHLEEALHQRRALGDWESVADLLGHRASRLEGTRRGRTMGEAGWVLEWHLEYVQWAFDCYRAALEAQPEQLHWLDGIARTWSGARISAERLAEELEDQLMELESEATRDAYFKILARLRERHDASAEAGRAYRTHGARESRENQLVLRIAMAQSGERDMLHQARRHSPRHSRTGFAQLARSNLSRADVERLQAHLDMLAPSERTLLVGELDLEIAAPCITSDDPPDLRLGATIADLMARRAPPTPTLQPEDASPPEARLRARLARRQASAETEENWTRAELEHRRSTDVAVERLVELAARYREVGRSERVEALHAEAATLAFPDDLDRATTASNSLEADQFVGSADASTLDVLYDAMRDTRQWELLEDALRAHVSRSDLDDARRTELFAAIAEVTRRHLGHLETAARALEQCWALSKAPAHLRELVEIELERDRHERAVEHQRRHFEVVSGGGLPTSEEDVSDDESSEPTTSDSVESGMALARLLLESEETRLEGVELLERLREAPMAPEDRETLLRRLADGYLALDQLRKAVGARETLLESTSLDETLEDWRELIELYDARVGDPGTAYELQWRLVRERETSESTLDRLVELADRSDSLDDCVEQLEDEAARTRGSLERQYFARAARVAGGRLGWHDKAVRLFSSALSAEKDAPAELLRDRTLSLARAVGREEEALEQFRRCLDVAPDAPRLHRAMLEMFEREQVHERSRLARQTLRFLDCDVDDAVGRKKMSPSRPFDDDPLEEHLLPDPLSSDLFYLFRQAVPLLRKVRGEALPSSSWSSHRLSEPDEGLRDAFDDAAYAFGLGRYRLESAEEGPDEPRVVGDKPSFWLHERCIEQLDEASWYFAAGCLSALAWSDLAPLTAIDGTLLWHLVEGTWLYHEGETLSAGDDVDPRTREMKEAVSSPFLTVTRRRVVRAIEPVRDRLGDVSPEQWPTLVERFARRVGLALCGDLGGALRALLHFRSGSTDVAARRRLLRDDAVGSLVRFAFTDDYLAARYDLGLGGRPSQVGLGQSF